MTATESLADHRPAKIALHHLERWAIVYVRQSHPQQVLRHPESAQVQANLQQLAVGWGWPRQRIKILDGDQGHSGTSTIGRDDFTWLLSEIALGHVGLVLGFQINRLAREDEACCRLIKICRSFDTLMADQDGLYHPVDFNDRLVLTIKGLMGGFELHQLQQRMQAGRLNRARRGEWLGQLPPGYVIGPDSKLQFDPDEQVQSVIRLIFDQFACLGSLSGLLRYLRQQHIELPYRVPSGPQRGQLLWHQPHRETLRSLLRRPAYAGVYTWGRRPVDPRRQVRAAVAAAASRSNQRPVRSSCPRITPVISPGSNTRAMSVACTSSVARTRSRPGAADRGGAGWLGGVRLVRLPHANPLHGDLALRLPAACLGLRHPRLPESGR